MIGLTGSQRSVKACLSSSIPHKDVQGSRQPIVQSYTPDKWSYCQSGAQKVESAPEILAALCALAQALP